MFSTSVPPARLALPHRKEIRRWLQPVSARDTPRALRLVAFDFLLFGLGLAALMLLRAPMLKLLLGLLLGLVIARLFILGHDACHQSFTPHRRLNRALGRLLFLPSLTPYSLWDVGHNVVHHGYTNLRGFDMVWEPLTLAEYQALPAWRQRLERIYRSGWAPWLYYLVEIWWRRMYFPSRRTMPTPRPVFVWDSLLVSGFAALWIGLLALGASASGQSVTLNLVTGFVLPWLVWNALIGFVVYVHHTHPAIAWYADKAEWSAAAPFVTTTVHLRLRLGGREWGGLLHHILQHTAHHVDMSLPLYRLQQAQRLLEQRLPGYIVVQDFSWRWYFDTARRCQLYDYQRRCWTDFSGQPTATPAPGPA
ncbi:MAG: fatty acid desaturase [Stagnimonas sp.]|nr:fatty acid desaturase [Stagnimonas sp.]